MPPNDAVPQAGPTCPMSDEELAVLDDTAYLADTNREGLLAIGRAFVTAERARLREVYRAGHGDHAAAQFDLACAIVDGTARDATTRRA